jgi:hypothetical protein
MGWYCCYSTGAVSAFSSSSVHRRTPRPFSTLRAGVLLATWVSSRRHYRGHDVVLVLLNATPPAIILFSIFLCFATPPAISVTGKNWPPLLHLLPIASAHGFACTSRTTLSRLRHISPSSAAMRAAPAGPALSSRRGDPPWPPSSAPPWTTHSEAFSFPSNHCFVVPWLLWCS